MDALTFAVHAAGDDVVSFTSIGNIRVFMHASCLQQRLMMRTVYRYLVSDMRHEPSPPAFRTCPLCEQPFNQKERPDDPQDP